MTKKQAIKYYENEFKKLKAIKDKNLSCDFSIHKKYKYLAKAKEIIMNIKENGSENGDYIYLSVSDFMYVNDWKKAKLVPHWVQR